MGTPVGRGGKTSTPLGPGHFVIGRQEWGRWTCVHRKRSPMVDRYPSCTSEPETKWVLLLEVPHRKQVTCL